MKILNIIKKTQTQPTNQSRQAHPSAAAAGMWKVFTLRSSEVTVRGAPLGRRGGAGAERARRLSGEGREGGGRARGTRGRITRERRGGTVPADPGVNVLFHAAVAGRFTETSHAGPRAGSKTEGNTCIQT